MLLFASFSLVVAIIVVWVTSILAICNKIDYKSGGLWNSLQICVLVKLSFILLTSNFNTNHLLGVYDRRSGAELFEIGTHNTWRKRGKKDEFIRELKKIGAYK